MQAVNIHDGFDTAMCGRADLEKQVRMGISLMSNIIDAGVRLLFGVHMDVQGFISGLVIVAHMRRSQHAD